MKVWSKREMKRRKEEGSESGGGELEGRQTFDLHESIYSGRRTPTQADGYTGSTCYCLIKLLINKLTNMCLFSHPDIEQHNHPIKHQGYVG